MNQHFNKFDLFTAIFLLLALITVIPLASLGYTGTAALCALGFLMVAAGCAKKSNDICFKHIQNGS